MADPVNPAVNGVKEVGRRLKYGNFLFYMAKFYLLVQEKASWTTKYGITTIIR